MDMEQKTVMVVTGPELPTKSLRELRDYIIESVQLGVLVLNSRSTYRMETMPDLGGVLIMGDELYTPLCGTDGDADPGSADDTGTETVLRAHDAPKYSGRAGEEKRAIFDRLLRYRDKYGLGCLDAVAEKTGGKISAETLREVLVGGISIPIEDWRRIGRALEKLEVNDPVKEAADG